MEKVRRLVLAVDASKRSGYDLSYSLYCQGDRSPREYESYEALSLAELLQAVEDLLDQRRPGWEYTPHYMQPPLWGSD